MKRPAFIALAIGVLLVGVIAFIIFHKPAPEPVPVVEEPLYPTTQTIGTSVEGRAITAYSYGNGPHKLVFVGGIHGGYEWNSVYLAYDLMDYLKANPIAVPNTETITVIPNMNPDGVFKVTGVEGRFTVENVSDDTATLAAGRFNAHEVDLNRNFDCHWQPTGTWQSRTVSAGTAAFSEPEAKAMHDYLLSVRPDAAVFWHSQSNAVYASDCGAGISTSTATLVNTYATASGYPKANTFTAYPVTGDVTDWLASVGIPAISVELSTHMSAEWVKNLAGINALIHLFDTSP